MRYKTDRILAVTAFLACLLFLRQGIILMQHELTGFDHHTRLIVEKRIDPSALFYTESPLALQAEKKVRYLLSTEQRSQ